MKGVHNSGGGPKFMPGNVPGKKLFIAQNLDGMKWGSLWPLVKLPLDFLHALPALPDRVSDAKLTATAPGFIFLLRWSSTSAFISSVKFERFLHALPASLDRVSDAKLTATAPGFIFC